jgi:hypothetical protein
MRDPAVKKGLTEWGGYWRAVGEQSAKGFDRVDSTVVKATRLQRSRVPKASELEADREKRAQPKKRKPGK